MDEKKGISTEFVAGQNSVIIRLAQDVQSEQRANHRETTGKIDAIVALIPDIQMGLRLHDTRITGLEQYKREEVEPLVDAHKKRGWVRVGWIGGLGLGALSSPAWVPKAIAILQAAFP